MRKATELAFPHHCQRCGKGMVSHTMSMFNLEIICMNCKDREVCHPDYPKAAAAEEAAVKAGDRNFPGIGCPSELYQEEKSDGTN